MNFDAAEQSPSSLFDFDPMDYGTRLFADTRMFLNAGMFSDGHTAYEATVPEDGVRYLLDLKDDESRRLPAPFLELVQNAEWLDEIQSK